MLLICPIPGWDFKYLSRIDGGNDYVVIETYLKDYLFCFMFFRIYFAIKWRFNADKYNDAFSKELCKSHGFYPSNWFILKTKFAKNTSKVVLTIFLVSVFILSFWIVTFEIDNLIEYSVNKTS